MNCKKKILAIIPARYASTRFCGKPLFLILGKTLLQRTFERVASCSFFEDVYIVTDDSRIYSHAKEINAKVLMTPPCATGTDRIIEALNKNICLQKADIIVNIQADYPLISPETIEKTVAILQNDTNAIMSTAATTFKDKAHISSPHAVKVVFDNNFNALYFSRNPIPFSKNLDKTNYYYHIGIYAYRTTFLKRLNKLKPTKNQLAENLEQLKVLDHGYKIKVALVNDKPIGVDTPQDVLKVEKYLCQ